MILIGHNITELRKLREESTQLDAVLLDRNMELVRLREENKDAEDQARVLRDELSHIADALGVAPYGGCYEQAEVLERAKALAKRVEALEKLLLDWRTEYGNGSIEREASRIAERRAGRAK